MQWKRRQANCLMVASILLMAAPVVSAHPHGWIDLSVKVISDDQDRVTALEQIWRMDPFYSLVVLEELGRVEGASLDEGLAQLGQEIRNNLVPMHYFTEVSLDGEPLELGEVTEYTTRTRDDRLIFTFRLPLAEPQSVADAMLIYQVFDPSYYIEVVHEADTQQRIDEDALILQGLTDCTSSVEKADPDPEVVMRAALLDQDEQGESGLGRYFAETGRIDCR